MGKEKMVSKRKFKVAICYPPVESKKGVPLLSQNRQFQYFNYSTFVYPMIPAYAATMAKDSGYNVLWMDGIAEKMSYEKWFSNLRREKPNLVLIETKTPVIKAHWKIVKEIKDNIPETVVVLVGDHVTYLPIESLENCPVDYILTGGDYDFLLVDLLECLSEESKDTNKETNAKRRQLPGGIFGRRGDRRVKLGELSKEMGNYWSSGPLELRHSLDSLPFIDRDLTKWQLYAFENGNYKYKPGTYMYSGRDCWWGRCIFCIWDQVLYPQGTYRRFSPKRLFEEVKYVVDKYGVKEIFDDAGTFFIGDSLKEFCNLMIDSGYNKKVVLGCNMRINALTREYCELMKKANFRFILYGLESANQETLDKLEKGLKVKEVESYLKTAKECGLEPHITVMLGYPWETEEMTLKTISFSKELFKKGYVDTMQATIVIPYPGSKLYNQCKENDWFEVDLRDYEAFDMRGPVMKVPFSKEKLMQLTRELYSSFLTPQYIFRRLVSIRSMNDIRFLIYSVKKLIGHLLDFDKDQI